MEGFLIGFGIIAAVIGTIMSLFGGFDPATSINLLWTGLVMLAGGIVLLCPGIVLYFKNEFQLKYQRVKNSQANIGLITKQYEELKGRLVELLEQYIGHEKGLVDVIRERGLDNLLALFEKYPELKASTAVSELMKQIVDLRKKITDSETAYNEDVRYYNEWTKIVPQKFFKPKDLPESISYQ